MIDLETTGLDPSRNQIQEIGAVAMHGGKIREQFHCYVEHKTLTYDAEAIRLFGTRLNDRKIGVPVWDIDTAILQLRAWKVMNFIGRPVLGGKNVGSFDYQFLRAVWPGIDGSFGHRFLDIGNLFHPLCPDEIPGLPTCLEIAKEHGFSSDYEVSHYALDDAMLCAELYQWLTNRF